MVFFKSPFRSFLIATCLLISSVALAASESQRKLYFFQSPIQTEVSLSTPMRAAHYATVGGMGLAKIGIVAYHMVHQPFAELWITGAALWDISRAAGETSLASLLHLKFLSRRDSRKSIAPLEQIPGVSQILMLISREITFSGPQAIREESKRFVFLKTKTPLDPEQEFPAELGRPLEITQPEQARITLSLVLGDNTSETTWDASVGELLREIKIPEAIAEQWETDFESFLENFGVTSRLISRSYRNQIQIKAKMTLEKNQTIDLGSIGEGKELEQILEVGLWNRFKKLILRQNAGSIPLNIKDVECADLLT